MRVTRYHIYIRFEYGQYQLEAWAVHLLIIANTTISVWFESLWRTDEFYPNLKSLHWMKKPNRRDFQQLLNLILWNNLYFNTKKKKKFQSDFGTTKVNLIWWNLFVCRILISILFQFRFYSLVVCDRVDPSKEENKSNELPFEWKCVIDIFICHLS